MTEQVAGTMVGGTDKQRGRPSMGRIVGYGVIAIVFVAVLLFGIALHDSGSGRPVAEVASATTTNQRSFPSVNATLLPLGRPAAPYMEDFTPRYDQNR